MVVWYIKARRASIEALKSAWPSSRPGFDLQGLLDGPDKSNYELERNLD